MLLFYNLFLPPFTINFVHGHSLLIVGDMLLGSPQVEKFKNKIMHSEKICIYSFNKLCISFNSLHRVHVFTHTVHIVCTSLGRQGITLNKKSLICDMLVYREDANIR